MFTANYALLSGLDERLSLKHTLSCAICKDWQYAKKKYNLFYVEN